MEEVSKLNVELLSKSVTANKDESTSTGWTSYLPVIFVFVGAFSMLALRLQIGSSFISDGALMMLALASYIIAALFQLTNLYAPSGMSTKIGYWGAALGVFFNLSSWLVRWVTGYEREIAQMRSSGVLADFRPQLPEQRLQQCFAFLQLVAELVQICPRDFVQQLPLSLGQNRHQQSMFLGCECSVHKILPAFILRRQARRGSART